MMEKINWKEIVDQIAGGAKSILSLRPQDFSKWKRACAGDLIRKYNTVPSPANKQVVSAQPIITYADIEALADERYPRTDKTRENIENHIAFTIGGKAVLNLINKPKP